MNKPVVPEELRRQVEAAMRSGQPLPRGVIAIGPGQTAPPGAVSLGSFDPKHPVMAKKAAQNPIPEGSAGFKAIRETTDCCNIPLETNNINNMLDRALDVSGDEEASEELVRDAIAKGVVVAMKVDAYCAAHNSRREVLSFEKYEELAELHKRVKELEKEAEEAQARMRAIMEEGKAVLQKRWETAVKLGGLSPENNYYTINEDSGCVEMVELNCHECKGAVKIRKARQMLQERLGVAKD